MTCNVLVLADELAVRDALQTSSQHPNRFFCLIFCRIPERRPRGQLFDARKSTNPSANITPAISQRNLESSGSTGVGSAALPAST